MAPVLGGEVIESEQRVAVLRETFAGCRVLGLVLFEELIEGLVRPRLRLGLPCQISCRSDFAFGCTLLGILLSTFAVLCTQHRCSLVSGKISRSAAQNSS